MFSETLLFNSQVFGLMKVSISRFIGKGSMVYVCIMEYYSVFEKKKMVRTQERYIKWHEPDAQILHVLIYVGN